MTQNTKDQTGELKAIGYELFIAALSILSIHDCAEADAVEPTSTVPPRYFSIMLMIREARLPMPLARSELYRAAMSSQLNDPS